MPRRREVPKREILPDPKFGSVDLSKFMNVVMESGKKAVAERIIYGALEQVEKKSGKDPLEVFVVALNNVKPMVEVKSRRVGGANYQVPVEVRPPGGARDALAEGIGSQARREVDGAAPRQRVARSLRRPRRCDEEARRSAPHGRGQQGLLALPLLNLIL
jgi:small subunit ribosomal protein S7